MLANIIQSHEVPKGREGGGRWLFRQGLSPNKRDVNWYIQCFTNNYLLQSCFRIKLGMYMTWFNFSFAHTQITIQYNHSLLYITNSKLYRKQVRRQKIARLAIASLIAPELSLPTFLFYFFILILCRICRLWEQRDLNADFCFGHTRGNYWVFVILSICDR